MAEMVAYVSTQMLHDSLREERLSYRVIEVADQVMGLVSFHGRLLNLLKNAHRSERVLSHIETIRYLSYRIEDVLETCALEVALMSQKNGERRIKRLFKKYFSLPTDASALKNIRAKILDIEPEKSSFCEIFPDGDPEIISSAEEPVAVDQIVRWPRPRYRGFTQEYFVGKEDNLQELLVLVIKEKQHRVISVWGDEGLGKTTIVRKIYYHPKVRDYFQAFAWVSLNGECQIRTLLRDILRQLGPGKVRDITEQQNMIDQLKEIQKQKNCLIVFDKVEELDQWKCICSGFNMEGGGIKILLTTRKQNIAEEGFPYKLRLFDEDEGWELLKKHAFPRKSAPEFGMFPKLGKEMVRKCGYLPLAISSLGRQLSSKITLTEWHMVNNDIAEYLQGDHHNEGDEKLFNILESRYDHLPYNLKQCFLYLGGIFREDESIDAEELIFLWMGEGMVSFADREREGAMMNTAEYYLRELALKGMLQVQLDEFSVHRRFKLCYLHHHARKLSLYQGEKEDFRLKVMDFCDGKPMLDSSMLSDGTRRLVIHFNKEVKSMTHDLVAMDNIRSLLFLNSDRRYVELPLRLSDLGKFKLLRVLHFVRCRFEERKLPKGIEKLANLRYFGLLYCDLDELPRSISSLRNLHVLNLRVCDTAQITVPNVLSQLVLLKHLHLPHYCDSVQTNKLILDGLLELETLVGFNCLIHDLSSLRNMKKLRHLVTHAYNNDSVTSIIKFITFYGAHIQTHLCIENKCDFTSSEGSAIFEETLMCPNLHSLTLSMVLIYKFPDCGRHASSEITQLKLIGCKIKEDPMEALGKFPNLQKLCLGSGAFVGREMVVNDVGFLKLEHLELRSLPNLEKWKVDGGAMCNLSALTIRRCPKLEKIPDGLTSISTLQSLEIELTPEALADGQEAEYRRKFEFVHSFIIRKLEPFSARMDYAH